MELHEETIQYEWDVFCGYVLLYAGSPKPQKI